MADTVTTNIVIDDATHTVVHLTCVSDGTGETAVNKINIATVAVNTNGKKPAGLRLRQIRWGMQGFTDVKLTWDRTAGANTAMVLSASGFTEYANLNQVVPDPQSIFGLQDPSEGNADGKGSILLTSVGAIAGATYDIDLYCTKAQNSA
jgi:hypothetical protein